ncbi:MFS transporter [bacterium]|nr:MFS transporter [bacterium]
MSTTIADPTISNQNPSEAQENSAKGQPRLWVFSTYFAEGLPYSIVRLLSSVYFTDIGMKERYIGYLNFLGIPWNLKFLWAPFLDIFGTKRSWLIALQALITLLTFAIAVINVFIPGAASPEDLLAGVSLVLVILAFLSASNDIAIDGFYMEGLPSQADQAAFTGYRVFAYRLAMILVRSGFVALVAGVAANETIKQMAGGNDVLIKYQSWSVAFAAAAATMLLATLVHIWKLPRIEKERDSTKQSVGEVFKKFAAAFKSYLSQEKVWIVIPFIIFYKVGDEVLFSMSTPFLMRELGVQKADFAWISGFMGAFGAIIGTTLGGLWIKKTGLKKAIWPLTLIMNVNILAYVWLAVNKPSPTTTAGIAEIAIIHTYEMLAAGMGTAVLTVYLLRTCHAEFKASHFAIGSAIMSLFSTMFGGFGGQIVEAIGYTNMFILAAGLTIPSMLLLFVVPIHDAK